MCGSGLHTIRRVDHVFEMRSCLTHDCFFLLPWCEREKKLQKSEQPTCSKRRRRPWRPCHSPHQRLSLAYRSIATTIPFHYLVILVVSVFIGLEEENKCWWLLLLLLLFICVRVAVNLPFSFFCDTTWDSFLFEIVELPYRYNTVIATKKKGSNLKDLPYYILLMDHYTTQPLSVIIVRLKCMSLLGSLLMNSFLLRWPRYRWL